MTERSETLTVTYQNGVVSVVGGGDVTIYQNETERITFQPGTGVQSVSSFSYTPDPLPTGVTVSWSQSGNDLVVVDADTLASNAAEVDVNYCVQITDSSGHTHWSDPQMINKPTERPN